MAESAFFPLVIYYLTTFYRRGELARRLAIFYAASNIANAFSGLLAYGVFQIKSDAFYKGVPGRLQNWRYLFIIEGSFTIVCTCPLSLLKHGKYLLIKNSRVHCILAAPEERP